MMMTTDYVHIGTQELQWLPVDIRIGCDAQLYFRNSYDARQDEWLQATEDIDADKLRIKKSDVERICLFAHDFAQSIQKVAKKEMTAAEFLESASGCWEPLLEHEVFVHVFTKFDDLFKVDIALDDYRYYQTENHPLWLYFRNGYTAECDEWLKIIVTDQGACLSEIKSEIKINERDFADLCHFVDKHHKEIRQLADGEIFYSQFIETIKASEK